MLFFLYSVDLTFPIFDVSKIVITNGTSYIQEVLIPSINDISTKLAAEPPAHQESINMTANNHEERLLDIKKKSPVLQFFRFIYPIKIL